MKPISILGVGVMAVGLILLGPKATPGAEPKPAAELKPGDAAPRFELPGSDGKTYKLDAFRDKKVVVLAWFPKAFTGG